jgi:hypothetical protein
MTPVSRQILASYAFFEQSKYDAGIPIQALVPFILPSIAGKGGTMFSSSELSASIQELFGPEAAKPIADSMLDPLVSAGYLRRDTAIKSEAIYFYTDLANDIPVDASISYAEQDLDEIIVVLSDYISVTSFVKPLSVTTSDLKTHFFEWVTKLDLSGISRSVNDNASSVKPGDKTGGSLDLLFSSFVRWAQKENDSIFNKITKFTEIGLVIDLVTELRVPTRRTKKVSLTVILDTRLLLEMLGLYGQAAQNSIKRLLELCRKYGVSVTTLVHLVDEVREITYNAINNPDLGGIDSVNEAMRMHPEVKLAVKGVYAAPDVLIRKEGVSIFPYKQIHDHNAEEFFTVSDIDKFAELLPYDKSKPNMARRDAQSLAYAVRRQNGVHTSNVYESKCVILTRSPRFINTARKYLRDNCDYPTYAVIPLMEFRHFSTMFMLSYGLDVARPVVRSELMAACDRVIRVSPGLTQRIRSVMRQWENVPTDQIEAALEDPVLLSELALATSNDPSSVTVSNGKTIYEMFRSAGQKEAEMRHLESERTLKSQHQAELEQIRGDAVEKEKEIQALRLQLFDQNERTSRISAQIEAQSDHNAKLIADRIERRVKLYWRCVTIVVAIVALLIFFDQVFHWTERESRLANVLAVLLGLVGAYHIFIAVAPDFAPETARSWMRKRVTEWELAQYSQGDLRDRVEMKLQQTV